jgi:hypothetical protein
MKLEEIKKMLLEKKEEEKKNRINKWNNMKPFKTVDDIPDIPILDDKNLYEELIVKNLIRCGAIPKENLEVGATYEGTCRNADKATWNGKYFDYKRYKFGEWEDAKINHFQDDNGFDLFVPIKKIS